MFNDYVEQNDDMFSSIGHLIDGKAEVERPHTVHEIIPVRKAPNPLAFITSPEFLDGPELFPLQFEVTRDFFELLCPFCNDVPRIHTKNDIPHDEQILFEHDICPNCSMHKSDISEQLNNYNELIGVVGMRAGKGVTIGCISAAIIHEVLCTENIQGRLSLVKNQVLDGAFIAASGEQASETVWGHFRGFYEGSPWFQKLKKDLMELEINSPKYRRGHLYKESETTISFKYKNFMLKSLHSNSASLAGKTRIFSVIDELARFDAGESKRSATEVYRVMRRSLTTVRVAVKKLRRKGILDVPDARMFCVSSPMFDEDKIMQLLRQAETQNKMFAYHRATWEANPEITREDLDDEFEADPLGAERDYGANPPGAENPFVQDKRVIDACISKDRESIFDHKEIAFDKEVKDIVFHYITVRILNVRYKNLADYVIHCDPGKNKDSFCMAIGHKEESGLVILDGALEVRPVPKKAGLQAREVYFPAMTDIILELNRKLSLKYVSYDRWNSLEQIDRLRDAQILAIGSNLDRDDHIKFLESMRNNLISFPKRESDTLDPSIYRGMPCSKALWELKGLQDDGHRVDHRPGSTNDMIQCYVGVNRLLRTPEKVFSQKILRANKYKHKVHKGLNRPRTRVVRLKRFV